MISTTLITYNRLEYTKKTLESYLATTSIPHELIVIDNASTDGTQKYLLKMLHKKKIDRLTLNTKNEYPGHATNQGWEVANKKAKFLHRSDNDLLYTKGWDKEAIQAFKDFPKMGQLGLINELYQVFPSEHHKHLKPIKKGKTTLSSPMNSMENVGGPCVVLKKIFDSGVKWKDDKWTTEANEDIAYSNSIKKAGYKVYELISNKVEHFGYGDIQKHFNYYFYSYWKRKCLDWFYQRLQLEREGRIVNGQTI